MKTIEQITGNDKAKLILWLFGIIQTLMILWVSWVSSAVIKNIEQNREIKTVLVYLEKTVEKIDRNVEQIYKERGLR